MNMIITMNMIIMNRAFQRCCCWGNRLIPWAGDGYSRTLWWQTIDRSMYIHPRNDKGIRIVRGLGIIATPLTITGKNDSLEPKPQKGIFKAKFRFEWMNEWIVQKWRAFLLFNTAVNNRRAVSIRFASTIRSWALFCSTLLLKFHWAVFRIARWMAWPRSRHLPKMLLFRGISFLLRRMPGVDRYYSQQNQRRQQR